MRPLKERLEQGALILDELDRGRRELNRPLFGFDTECLIVAEQLRELEADIQRDPGALKPYLVRRGW